MTERRVVDFEEIDRELHRSHHNRVTDLEYRLAKLEVRVTTLEEEIR